MKDPFTQYEQALNRDTVFWRLLPHAIASLAILIIIFVSWLVGLALLYAARLIYRKRLVYVDKKRQKSYNNEGYNDLFRDAIWQIPKRNITPYELNASYGSWLVLSPTANGSAFLWQENILITCLHCVANVNIKDIRFVNPATGKFCKAKNVLYATEQNYDIAIVELEDREVDNAITLELAKNDAAVNSPVWTYKLRGADNYCYLVGRDIVNPENYHIAWEALHGAAGDLTWFFHAEEMQRVLLELNPGMSGSPIFNDEGAVVGIATATSHFYGYITPVSHIKALLEHCPFAKPYLK